MFTDKDRAKAAIVNKGNKNEAKGGNIAAIKEVLDRAEGKVQSQTDIISSDGSLQSNLKIEFVDAADPEVSK